MEYFAALKLYLSQHPLIKQSLRGESLESISPSTLPAQYNDVKFNGDKYVNNKCCKTVGEYKAACDKFYDPV